MMSEAHCQVLGRQKKFVRQVGPKEGVKIDTKKHLIIGGGSKVQCRKKLMEFGRISVLAGMVGEIITKPLSDTFTHILLFNPFSIPEKWAL